MKYMNKKNGSALLGAALFVMVMSFIVGNYLVFVSSGSISVKKMNDMAKAFYLAEAGLQRISWEIGNGGPTSVTATLGDGSYSASYSSADSEITSTGTVSGINRTVTMNIAGMPPMIRGALTAYSDVSTTGNITIDGRDHDVSGALNGSPGTYGISTTGDYLQQGSSTVGGNGIAPASPGDAASYEENATPVPPSYNPWDVLGVTQDWYNANVTSSALPPSNFTGVVSYSPPGGTWNPANLGFSVGILIVHNSSFTATIKNVQGTLIGILIADNVTHINGSALIIGAVVTANQTGNTIGNGSAQLLYSAQAVENAGVLLGNTSGWVKTLRAGTWRES